jgi:hypothetical protein
MALGNFGKVLADQAIEATKRNVLGNLGGGSEPAKPSDSSAAKHAGAPEIGPVILGQLQAMQKALREDQELRVEYYTGIEVIHVLEIFVPTPQVFVISGTDATREHAARIIAPAATAVFTTRIAKVEPGVTPIRLNVLSPRPRPE